MQEKCSILILVLFPALLLLGCRGHLGEKPMPSGGIVQETFVNPDPEVLERQQQDAEQGRETWRLTSPEKVARGLEPEFFRILRSDDLRLKELNEGEKKATVEVVRKSLVVAEVELARYRNETNGIWFVTKVRVFVTTQ